MKLFTLVRSSLILILLPLTASAQDTVIVTGADGKTPVTRYGEIVDYTGAELTLKTSAGRRDPIPRSRILEIKTIWLADHLRGRELRSSGKLEAAIEAYREAKNREQRPWARRQIQSELTECYAESGRFDLAGEEFLAIVAADPLTHHLAVMPLAWRPFPPDAAVEARAAAWLSSDTQSPAATILGASWLLSTSRRGEAIQALAEVAESRGRESDERMSQLAQVQLWRTRLVTAKADEVARWKAAALRMPPEVAACGWYVIGEALARHKQPEEAALAYMRVPLVHGQQRVMSADSLVAAGEQLETLGRSDQAAGLYREVLADYAACPAAREAQSRLAALAKSP
jgi:tetratricopeptide (TPR) repeat protein